MSKYIGGKGKSSIGNIFLTPCECACVFCCLSLYILIRRQHLAERQQQQQQEQRKKQQQRQAKDRLQRSSKEFRAGTSGFCHCTKLWVNPIEISPASIDAAITVVFQEPKRENTRQKRQTAIDGEKSGAEGFGGTDGEEPPKQGGESRDDNNGE